MRRSPRTKPGTARGAPLCSARRPGAAAGSPGSSHRLEPEESENGHLEQQPAVGKPPDVRGPVIPFQVMDRDLQDLEVELGGPEEEVEVAERIEVAEIPAISFDAAVILAPEHLGAAERVIHPLVVHAGDRRAEWIIP